MATWNSFTVPKTPIRFANGSANFLASDVGARGLDIEAVDVVFNYSRRRSRVYTHRIGRTGRGGEAGSA
ncbi:MAG: hypothetical protein CM15mP120_28370 [Pseudomonadota bacterium]|nr:MAG: hypothetical protein CM15mP120_28370 [Pseudomonadota bacterium]